MKKKTSSRFWTGFKVLKSFYSNKILFLRFFLFTKQHQKIVNKTNLKKKKTKVREKKINFTCFPYLLNFVYGKIFFLPQIILHKWTFMYEHGAHSISNNISQVWNILYGVIIKFVNFLLLLPYHSLSSCWFTVTRQNVHTTQTISFLLLSGDLD